MSQTEAVSETESVSEMRWFDAGDVDELWEGDVVEFDADGDQVLIARLDGGEIKAFQGTCPHQEYPLGSGVFDTDSCVLTCAGHSWEFDLRTGTGVNPTGSELYSFPVRVVESKIEVGVPQDGQRHYYRFSPSQGGTP
ncbi:Rieske 2Fe-2S domain-containing protein [Mycobacterium intracellulare]|uniref:Rieske 2Fe-2S domain-containing protein n=1 Tax=Mycobacterium intracellulare TaxID=1767 RepID=UPI001E471733|nr:Rieske 2Fe-2S domain-containing protein [Mycobacterium intracellulare]